MASARERLQDLQRAVEEATGAMMQVAQHLDEVAGALPDRSKAHRLLVEQNADRLRAAAHLLTAEAAASNPSTVRRVAEVAAKGLLAVGVLVGPGASEGVSSTMTEHVLAARDRAVVCVQDVERESSAIERIVRSEVHKDLLELEDLLLSSVRHPSAIDGETYGTILVSLLPENAAGVGEETVLFEALDEATRQLTAAASRSGDHGFVQGMADVSRRLDDLRSLVWALPVDEGP